MTALEATLTSQIQRYLNDYVYDNARFLAERLVAHHPTEKHKLLLATCYYCSRQKARAAAVLDGATRPKNRYLLACCCLQLDRLAEAENALLGSGNYQMDDLRAIENVPSGASGLYLLGKIYRRGNRRQQAVTCFVKSLEIDPFLWSAYEQLCQLGANLESSRFFGAANYFNCAGTAEKCDRKWKPKPELSEDSDGTHLLNDGEQNDGENQCAEDQSSTAAFATPKVPTHFVLDTPQSAISTFNTCDPLAYKTQTMAEDNNDDNHGNMHTATVVKKPRVSEDIRAPARQRKKHRRQLPDSDENFRANARLSFSAAVLKESPQNLIKPTLDSPTSARLTRRQTPKKTGTPNIRVSSQEDGRLVLLRLLNSFGLIYRMLSFYMCREALVMLEQLPASQYASAWAQQQRGRAHFELADYVEAREVFDALYRVEPHRMEGLDVYSTTLWHLKKDVELSYLAQRVTDFDKLSCEAWCVAGNCFSLQKEHDIALTFFQRAIQLDPSFTYAYTLSGHEYVANENFEKAVNCYRHALRTNARHYNAWYGLGTIYYRQEKFQFAEYHFQRALEINPRSSLLHCFLGMVLHSTHRYDEALTTLAIAAKLQPLNPQARFQRANVLVTLQRYEEALNELHVVKNFAPRESSVHFMMGKVAKKLGRIEDAMKFFTLALHFHSKDNTQIKTAIDQLNETTSPCSEI
ncbi:hypothetical protein PsorP6_004299 [Peronosclerospora sorghi]|uniref:Uncharacterized protein n=1 Tax=Peronosclerospora sorghi TaxID=230839 RepID=A0ACC0VN20_9STRA|nr:hypothetical protein PsorP6_004299 [Peronosclerospora sorghi]